MAAAEGLPPGRTAALLDEVRAAMSAWPSVAPQAGVSAARIRMITAALPRLG